MPISGIIQIESVTHRQNAKFGVWELHQRILFDFSWQYTLNALVKVIAGGSGFELIIVFSDRDFQIAAIRDRVSAELKRIFGINGKRLLKRKVKSHGGLVV